jgi:hypothetical protein
MKIIQRVIKLGEEFEKFINPGVPYVQWGCNV